MTVKVDHYCQCIGAMRIPMKLHRYAQRLALRAGVRHPPLTRHDGEGPQFLVRVDEFPYGALLSRPEQDTAMTSEFHAILRAAGLPYLMAVLPRLSADYLDPEASGGRDLDSGELALLSEMRHDGVTFAQHGLDHRTTRASSRRHSEFAGRSDSDTMARLDEGREILRRAGIEVRAFVPPFNRFDRGHWPLLRDRYEIVCGGPETIAILGLQPLQRDASCTYVPSYPPYYGRSATMIEAIAELIATRAPVTVPITLHTIWEMDGHAEDLRRLADLIKPHTLHWDDL